MSIAAGYGSAEQLQVQVRSLLEECANLRKDAERYRWLRKGENDAVAFYERDCALYMHREEKLDAAIDAAMREQGANVL